MVLVSSADRRKLYAYLLQEGVFCTKKDNIARHEGLDITHLQCFLVMRSLKSRKFVTEVFSWRVHYYFLTQAGVIYLREYLGLPESVVPNTHRVDKSHKKEDVEEGQEADETGGEDRPRRGGRGGRGTRGRGGRGRGDREETPAEA
jgi:small subunit ribosomal protein S10e